MTPGSQKLHSISDENTPHCILVSILGFILNRFHRSSKFHVTVANHPLVIEEYPRWFVNGAIVRWGPFPLYLSVRLHFIIQ